MGSSKQILVLCFLYFLLQLLLLSIWMLSLGIGNIDEDFVLSFVGGTHYLSIDSALYRSLDYFDLQSIISIGLGTNYIPVLAGDLFDYLSPNYYYLLAYIFNLLVLVLSFCLYLRSVFYLFPKKVKLAIVCWVLYPFFFICTGLNKEILGVFSICLLLFGYVRYNSKARMVGVIYFFMAMIVAFFTRNVLFVTILGFLFLLVTDFKLGFWKMLTAFSFVMPVWFFITDGKLFGGDFFYVGQVASIHGMKTADLFEFSAFFYPYPLGYIFSFFINFSIYLLAPVLNPSYWINIFRGFNLSEFFLIWSSMYISYFMINLLIRKFWRTNVFACQLLYLFVILVSVMPISQHRYLIVIVPLLIVFYLHVRAIAEGDRSGY